MNARTWAALAIVAASAVGCGLWGMRFFLGAAAVFTAVIAAFAVRNWRRAGRLYQRIIDEEAPRPPVSTLAPAIAAGIGAAIKGLGDDALALICDPCNGRPGTCRCPSKESCPNPKCGAPDTRIKGWSAAEIAYLRGETEELPRG